MTETTTLPAHIASPVLHLPTRTEVQKLRPGDLALDCFGRWVKVVSIHAQRDDVKGRAFACFYLAFGRNGSTISGSIKEGELVRTVALSRLHGSADLDAIERKMRSEQGV